MKARIVRVGNSRGIRLPKPVLEESGLDDEVEIHPEPGRIQSARRRRSGWAEAARDMEKRGDDGLVDEPMPTEFDREE